MPPGSDSGGAVYERELLAHLPDVHRHPGRWGYRWWVSWLPWATTILRCWKRERFDLLRAHSARFTGPACILAQRLGVHAKLVAHHHHLDPIWQSEVDLWALRHADGIITDSEFSRRQLITRAPELSSRITVIRPASRVMPRANPATGQYALFVGALKPRKNVAWLVRQWRTIPFPLVIVGDGSCRAEIERLLTPNIRLAGRVTDEALFDWYAKAAFFVFPTLLEGYGMPVADAVAAGLPCLVSNRGSLPELVTHGFTGFITPLMTEPFVDAAKQLASDPGLRAIMGGHATMEKRRSWEMTATDTQVAYHRLLTQ